MQQFYAGQGVAANDVGVMNFLADLHCLDLWGISNLDVARKGLKGEYTAATIVEQTRQRNVRVAVVYDSWFQNGRGLPQEWVRVRCWTIPDNIACGSETVPFYAVDSAERDSLVRNLQAFAQRLPKDVVQSGSYCI